MAAAKKKDFSKVNTNPVYDAIAEATAEPIPGQLTFTDKNGTIAEEQPAAEQQQPETEKQPTAEKQKSVKKQITPPKKKYKQRKTYTAEEAQEALDNLQTAGKKGVKLPRINLAFTPANYEFIKIMAQVRGQNLTEFVNDMLAEARTQHADIYQKAIEFRNSL